MPQLAAAGYHVIAPDQRGYGRTTGWDADYDGDLASFRLLNLVRDALGLVSAFGYRAVDAVVGHDFGSGVAAWCALLRPDVFRSVALMSAPFAGPPPLPFNTADAPARPKREDPVYRELAALPRPRKYYQLYYSTREANADMHRAPQGVHDFLRAYYHHKSADWKANKPHRLTGWTASELAKMPTYYVMDFAQQHGRDRGGGNAFSGNRSPPTGGCPTASFPSTAPNMNAPDSRAACNGIAAAPRLRSSPELQTWSGRSIDVPSCFISGKQDWGTYQRPGVYEAMQQSACTRMLGCHLVDGAGHWVQQEQPAEVSRLLLQFLKQSAEQAVR